MRTLLQVRIFICALDAQSFKCSFGCPPATVAKASAVFSGASDAHKASALFQN
jgi:hypothetical protein